MSTRTCSIANCSRFPFADPYCEDHFVELILNPLLNKRRELIQQLSDNETALLKAQQRLHIYHPPEPMSVKQSHKCPTCKQEQGSFFALSEHISLGCTPPTVGPSGVCPNKPARRGRIRGFVIP